MRADAPAVRRGAARTARGLGLLAVGGALLAGCGAEPAGAPARAGRTVSIVVPAGTAARVAAGERVSDIPDRIVARVGDTLRLVNHDRVSQRLGPFLVGPGQTISSALARSGTFTGDCTAHPGRSITIVVLE